MPHFIFGNNWHRALIEAELYRNRYKHSSKNDDDLPIVR
jgi:hypothetical protein